MTPKEKAIELYNKFRNENSVMTTNIRAKKQSLIAVDEVISALTEYGKESMELQNMDSEFRYWDSVKEAVKSF